MIDLIYKEQTYQLRGFMYEVHNRLGIGWDEETYHQATLEAFKAAGVPVDSKVRQIIKHRGVECQNELKIPLAWDKKKLPEFTSDHFMINGNCLLNIRAALDHPTQYDFLRMKTYLRTLGLPLGLIVNFGKKQLQIHGVNAF